MSLIAKLMENTERKDVSMKSINRNMMMVMDMSMAMRMHLCVPASEKTVF